MSADGPIFIGGLSGSGKTQLRVVLDADPALSLTRRTSMWTRYYGRFGDLHDDANRDRCVRAMVADRRVQLLHPDEARITREFAPGPYSYARLIGLFHEHHAQRNGKRRWGDQLSFVECFADPIFAAFPSARMVHMVSDPRARFDAAASARRGKIGWDTAMWLHSARLAQRNRLRHPGRYRVVRYEHLAARPVATIETVCSFLGVPFVDAMRDVIGSLRFDVDGQVLTAGDASFVETYTRAELAHLGYAGAPSVAAPGPRLAYWLGDWPIDRTAMAAWRTVRRRRMQRQVAT
jgi:hypothetical protein